MALFPSQEWILSPTISSLALPPRNAIDRLRQQGWRGVQLDVRAEGTRPGDLGESGRRDLRSSLRRSNQELTGLDFWIPMQAWTSSETVQRALDATVSSIDLAADLGRCPVSMVLPGDEVDSGVLDAICSHAMSRGVRLADHRVEAVMSGPSHGIGIDPVALLSSGVDPAGVVNAAAEQLVSVRLGDLDEAGQRVPPGIDGTGRLDLTAYKVALTLRSWTSGVVVDLRQWPDPAAGMQQAREAWAAADASAGAC